MKKHVFDNKEHVYKGLLGLNTFSGLFIYFGIFGLILNLLDIGYFSKFEQLVSLLCIIFGTVSYHKIIKSAKRDAMQLIDVDGKKRR